MEQWRMSQTRSNDSRFSSLSPGHHHLHDWGQSESGISRLVARITNPGQFVCDPFLGGGTTAIACLKLARKFIGCDNDAEAIKTAKARTRAAAAEVFKLVSEKKEQTIKRAAQRSKRLCCLG